jgi:TolA-binding protein
MQGNPAAPMAQAKLAVMWTTAAHSLGSYKALNNDEKMEWEADTDKAASAAEQALAKFPTARETGVALEEMVKLTLLKIDAGLLTAEQGAAFFADAAAKASEPAKGRLDLARIAVLIQRGKADEAVALYRQAETAHPGLIYDPEDLERSGGALLAAKQYDPATAAFTRMQKEFPKEPRVQAAAVYGLGAVQLAQGNATAADPYFDTLEKQYPWSDKIWEATLGRGLAAENRNDMTQARAYYQKVIMASASTPEMKARGLFGFAHSLEKEGKLVPNAASPNDPNAVNNYLKIDALFDTARAVAAEGLWRAGQILEKAGQTDKAKPVYQTLVKKYSESEFADDAQARMTALGG